MGFDGFEYVEYTEDDLANPTDLIYFQIYSAIKDGMDIDRIRELTNIDNFFLYKIRNIVNFENDVTADKLVLKGATGATDQELTAAKVASYDGYDSRITANTNRFDGFASDTQTVAQYVTANAKDATYDATHTIA